MPSLDRFRPNRERGENAQSLFDRLTEFVRDLSNSSHSQQILFGGVSGLACGFLSNKIGRWVAVTGGLSIIALQVAKDKGYIKLEKRRICGDFEKIKREIKEQFDIQPSENEVVTFVKKNHYLLVSFGSGFLIGWGIA